MADLNIKDYIYIPMKRHNGYQTNKVGKDFVCLNCGNRMFNTLNDCYRCGKKDFEMRVYDHIKMIPTGKAEEVRLFMQLLMRIDPDWVSPQQCQKCEGYIIKTPTLMSRDLFLLAKQCGVKKIKIKKWQGAEKCTQG